MEDLQKGDKVIAKPVNMPYIKSKFKYGEEVEYTGVCSDNPNLTFKWKEFTNGTNTDILLPGEYDFINQNQTL